jgi:hypothetical protein
MVRPERFELPTLWFEARCSIQLSYGCVPLYVARIFTPDKPGWNRLTWTRPWPWRSVERPEHVVQSGVFTCFL